MLAATSLGWKAEIWHAALGGGGNMPFRFALAPPAIGFLSAVIVLLTAFPTTAFPATPLVQWSPPYSHGLNFSSGILGGTYGCGSRGGYLVPASIFNLTSARFDANISASSGRGHPACGGSGFSYSTSAGFSGLNFSAATSASYKVTSRWIGNFSAQLFVDRRGTPTYIGIWSNFTVRETVSIFDLSNNLTIASYSKIVASGTATHGTHNYGIRFREAGPYLANLSAGQKYQLDVGFSLSIGGYVSPNAHSRAVVFAWIDGRAGSILAWVRVS